MSTPSPPQRRRLSAAPTLRARSPASGRRSDGVRTPRTAPGQPLADVLPSAAPAAEAAGDESVHRPAAYSDTKCAMKPVAVSIDVPQSPERVYEHIDALANHESFTDHMLVDWKCSGPRAVGAREEVWAARPARLDRDGGGRGGAAADDDRGVGKRRRTAPDPRHVRPRGAPGRRHADQLPLRVDRGAALRPRARAAHPRDPEARQRAAMRRLAAELERGG